MTVNELVRLHYLKKLNHKNIPLDPAERTADQGDAASLLYWSVQLEFAAVATLTQSAVEA